MKNKIKTTITLSEETLKELQLLKYNGGYKTIEEVIKVLLGKR